MGRRPSPPPTRALLATLVAVIACAALGCVREQQPAYCPVVESGDLVISELRGEQDGDLSHYVEIYNASGATVDLVGLQVQVRAATGEELSFFVRETVEVAAGGYAVLGPGDPQQPKSYIDYSIGWDLSGGKVEDGEVSQLPTDLFKDSAAFVELIACGELIDQMFYSEPLPMGTLACGNADAPPSANANDSDEEGCWCVDAAPFEASEPGETAPGTGLPGTPGGANRCL